MSNRPRLRIRPYQGELSVYCAEDGREAFRLTREGLTITCNRCPREQRVHLLTWHALMDAREEMSGGEPGA